MGYVLVAMPRYWEELSLHASSGAISTGSAIHAHRGTPGIGIGVCGNTGGSTVNVVTPVTPP